MNKQSPILITGVPRSGTSMIAASINLCGAFAGGMSKRGRYSNDEIREELVKPYLKSVGGDDEGHYPLPQRSFERAEWKNEIECLLYHQGYDDGPWMYKDSRLCLMWQVWNHAYPSAKWVIVRRKTSDIVYSCLKTGYMRRFKNHKLLRDLGFSREEDGWIWMIREYEKRFTEMVQEGLNCKIIWPERMVQGNYEQMHELCEWLNLPWRDDVLNFINPLLWGNSLERRQI